MKFSGINPDINDVLSSIGLRLLSYVVINNVSIGYVVGGEKSPIIPIIIVEEAGIIDENGLLIVTYWVEYKPLHVIVELFIFDVLP